MTIRTYIKHLFVGAALAALLCGAIFSVVVIAAAFGFI